TLPGGRDGSRADRSCDCEMDDSRSARLQSDVDHQGDRGAPERLAPLRDDDGAPLENVLGGPLCAGLSPWGDRGSRGDEAPSGETGPRGAGRDRQVPDGGSHLEPAPAEGAPGNGKGDRYELRRAGQVCLNGRAEPGWTIARLQGGRDDQSKPCFAD